MATPEEIEASAKRLGMSQKMLDIQQYPMPSSQASHTAQGNIVLGNSVPVAPGVTGGMSSRPQTYTSPLAPMGPPSPSEPASFADWAGAATEIQDDAKGGGFADWASGASDTKGLAFSLQAGQEQDPDTAARVFRLQAKTGLPEEYIQENVDNLEKEVSRKEFNVEEYRKKSPVMAAWLAKNPNNAAVAQDELDRLWYIEKQWKFITNRFSVGQKNQELKDIGLSAMWGQATPEQRAKQKELEASISQEDYGITGFVEGIPGSTAEMLPLYWSTIKSSPQYIGAGAGGGAVAGGLAGAAAGPGGAVAGAAVGAGEGAYLGFNIGSGIEAGKMEAGLAYLDLEKLKDDNGAPLDRSTMVGAALVVGSINGALEMIPASTLAKKIPLLRNFTRPGMKKILANRTMRKMFLDYAKGIGEQAIAEGGTEFLQEGVKIVAEAVVSDKELMTEENLLQALAAGRAGMQGGAGMAIAHQAVTAPSDMKKVREAKETGQAFRDLGENIKESKLQQRLPEKMREALGNLEGATGMDKLFIPVQAWNQYWQESQGVDPREVAKEILGDATQYDDALRTGKEIEISPAEYASKIAATDHNQFFSQEVRAPQQEMNEREAGELEKKLQQEAEKAVEATKEPAAEEKIQEHVTESLTAAGVDKVAAGKLATVVGQRYKTRAQILGVDPLELFKQESPGIKKLEGSAGVDAVAQFDQKEAPNAPPFYSKLTQTVEQKMGGSASVEQINGMLKEIKPEERKWSGIDEFLAGKQKVSKEELLTHLRGNALEVKEVTKGGATAEEVSGEYWVEGDDENGWRVVDWAGNEMETFDNEGDAMEWVDNRAQVEDATKFSQYTLPGGENYREVLFTLPEKGDESHIKALRAKRSQAFGEAARARPDQGIGQAAKELGLWTEQDEADLRTLEDAGRDKRDFRSSHFEEANVLAHTRLNDRVDADGKRVLFVEEIQSDWHQAGRKKGYRGEGKPEVVGYNVAYTWSDDGRHGRLANAFKTREEAEAELAAAEKRYGEDKKEWRIIEIKAKPDESNAVPDAPFRKTWHEFVLKRIIRMAAEQGYDRVAWTTGEQQAERYDLGKKIDNIEYVKMEDGTYYVAALELATDEHPVHEIRNATTDQIEATFGKEIAKKIEAGEGKGFKGAKKGAKKLSGVDLKVGGEGMKGFYDKILVDFANKFGKKFGAKVGVSEIAIDPPEPQGAYPTLDGNLWAVVGENNDQILTDKRFETEQEAMNWIENAPPEAFADYPGTSTKVHSLDITPAMKQTALKEGFSLFQKDTDVRGRFSITQDGLTIELSDKANLSTFIHETGHLYLHEMGKDVARLKEKPESELTDQQKQFLVDADLALKWLGVESFADIKVDHHEKWARGFEAYHMEGKAPSLALRKVFASFRAWLIHIYKQIKNLDVELSDEVRGVFDRMIATQEEIEAARAETKLQPLFPDPRKAGMNDKQSVSYLNALNEAKVESEETLTEKLIDEMHREQKSWWKEGLARLKEEVAKEVDQEKDQIALALLTKGKQPDGSALPENASGGFGPGNLKAIKINKASIERVIRSAALAGRTVADIEKLPRIMSKTGGVDVDTAAEMLGYDYGEDLIAAMAKVEPRKERIKRLADQKMRERHGDLLLDDVDFKEEAIRAIHNEKRGKLLEMELRHLIDNHFSEFKTGMKKVAKKVPSIKAIKQEASEMLARMKVRDIRPEAFLRAEQRHAKDAVDAYLKGDFEKAFDLKEKELLNHELYKASTEAREYVDKTLEYMKKFRTESKRKQLGKADYLEQIDAILHRFEFARVPEKEIEARKKSLSEWLKEVEANGESAGEEVYAPDILKNEMFRKNYKDMTFEELQGVRDAVKQMEHMAIQADKSLSAQKKIRREEMQTQLIGAIVSNLERRKPRPFTKSGMSRMDKAGKIAREFDVSLLKMEQVIDWMDGGDIAGPWRALFFQGASVAQAKEYDYTANTTAKIAKLVHNIPKEIRQRMDEGVKIPGIERKLTRRDLLGVALNTGNESNQTKMLKGMGWNEEQLQAMKDELTKEEWDFIQGIWDTLEEMWPEIAALQKELTGLEPDKVEVRPVQTKHGEYKGGYYPMMYDAISSTTGQMQLSAKIGSLTEDGYTRATTPKGHTKGRVENFSAPLDLDIDNLPSHIAGVVKDLTHRKWLIDANWIVGNREIRAAVAEHLGEEYVHMLTDWVKQVANDKNHNSLASLSIWRRMLTHFRYNAVITAMGFKASTVISQLAGVGMSIETVGGKEADGRKYMQRAYGEFLRAPMQKYKEVSEKSGEMRHRLETKDRDLRDKLRLLSGKEDILSKTQEVALYGIGLADMMVSVPTWLAGYQKAIEQGKTEDQAIQAGDRAVRLSQGSSGAKDMAAVMSRNNDFLRTITMFYTPFSALYSRLRDIGHDFKESPSKACIRLFWTWIFANTMAELLTGKQPDDDEGWLKWWLKSNLAYPFMTIPGLRDVVNGIAGDYGYTPSPLAAVGKTTSKAGKTALGVLEGKKDAGDLAKDTFAASQYWLGIPTKQIEITGTYWTHLLQGKESPDDLGEFTRKTLFKSEKK